MKNTIFIIACTIFLSGCSCDITEFLSLTEAELAESKAFVAECYNSSKIDEVIYSNAVACRDMSDNRMQDFLHCFFRKYNFVTEDNKFNTVVVQPNVSDYNYKMAVRCSKVPKRTRNFFQQIAQFFECFVKNFLGNTCPKRRNRFWN